MTTFATQPEIEHRIAELDTCKRAAWTVYREDVRGLEGRIYDAAESASWERLQAALRDLDAERAALAATDVPN
ncbi:MAG: hypothetical protein QOK16_4222 [Solirubrobacteraceae bacterium]|jgi:hypothetical protein|nr:hypothetical protein [Solirubrobacteraceae bacterium]